MTDLVVPASQQQYIEKNELWRLVKEEHYLIDENSEISILMDFLDLRKNLEPPETNISFNKVNSELDLNGKTISLMNDLYLKLSLKDEHLFAGLIDEDAYRRINKKEKLIEFLKDKNELDNHYGLYYLTEDLVKLNRAKGILLALLQECLSSIIGSNEELKAHNAILKQQRKEYQKEQKKIKKLK